MLISRPVDLAKHLLEQLHRHANTDIGDIVIGALCMTLIYLANPDFQFGDSMPLNTMDMQTLVHMHFIKTKQPLYWFTLPGDQPFPLPNDELIFTGDMDHCQNWHLDTPAHEEARALAEQQYGRQRWHRRTDEHEAPPGGHEDPPLEKSESSNNPRR